MRLEEAALLVPWLEAGVGVTLNLELPDPILVKKRYLQEVEGGYALTLNGKRQGWQRIGIGDDRKTA